MAGHAKFQVYYLASPSDPQLPRWIDYQRCGEHRWRAMYENRDRLPESRLIRWFRELKGEPLEVRMLGRSVALNQKTAVALVRFMVRETNRMATGDPDRQADFLCNENHPGGRGCGRTIMRIDADGSVICVGRGGGKRTWTGAKRDTRAAARALTRPRKSDLGLKEGAGTRS